MKRTCDQLGLCQMQPTCAYKCTQRRALGGVPNFPFAPGVIQRPRTRTDRRQLARTWGLRITGGLAAVALVGLCWGHLT